MPRKQLRSLHSLMENGYDIPYEDCDSAMDLNNALRRLPSLQRIAIQMRFGIPQKPASFTQIGKKLHCDRNRASRIIQAGLEELRRLLS